ncbi:MAG: hypothetical protein KDB66_01275 [Solirubrobacterales bacterium]|nr:hypothetical protein [Solirubrobacterales bacterium]MCB8915805.1 hypothetical protein [Thermoleophilales bacterium]
MADQAPRQPVRRKARDPERDRRTGADAMKAGYAKSEVKNQAVRDELQPLTEGERPLVVTVGAILSAVVALILWGSCLYALVTGADAGGRSVNVFQWGFFALVISAMAWGMWKAKYWAVLGFQMLLVLLIMAGVLGLVTAPTLLQIVSTLILTAGLSVLFWFMVKAMARIQMPERPGS